MKMRKKDLMGLIDYCNLQIKVLNKQKERAEENVDEDIPNIIDNYLSNEKSKNLDKEDIKNYLLGKCKKELITSYKKSRDSAISKIEWIRDNIKLYL